MNRHLDEQELLGVVFELDEGPVLEAHSAHLATCAECRAKAAALKARIDQVALLRDDVRAPATLIERTLAATEEPRGTLIPWPRTIALLASAAAIAVVALWQPWQMPQHRQPETEIEVALVAAPAAAAPQAAVPVTAPEPVVMEPKPKDAREAPAAVAVTRASVNEVRPASVAAAAPIAPARQEVAAARDEEATRMRKARTEAGAVGSAAKPMAQPMKAAPPPPAAAPAPAPLPSPRSLSASRPVEPPAPRAPVVAAKRAVASGLSLEQPEGRAAAPGASRDNVADASTALGWDADGPSAFGGGAMAGGLSGLTLQLPDGNRIVNEQLSTNLAYRLVRNGASIEVVWHHAGTQAVNVTLFAPGTKAALQTVRVPAQAIATNRLKLPVPSN